MHHSRGQFYVQYVVPLFILPGLEEVHVTYSLQANYNKKTDLVSAVFSQTKKCM